MAVQESLLSFHMHAAKLMPHTALELLTADATLLSRPAHNMIEVLALGGSQSELNGHVRALLPRFGRLGWNSLSFSHAIPLKLPPFALELGVSLLGRPSS